MKVQWIAYNGQRFTIIADTMEEVQEEIAALRKQHNLDEPTVMVAEGDMAHKLSATKIEDLPEHLQTALKEAAEQTKSTPDPKKMN